MLRGLPRPNRARAWQRDAVTPIWEAIMVIAALFSSLRSESRTSERHTTHLFTCHTSCSRPAISSISLTTFHYIAGYRAHSLDWIPFQNKMPCIKRARRATILQQPPPSYPVLHKHIEPNACMQHAFHQYYSGSAAVSPFQPPGAAAPEVWAIWNSTQVDHAGTTGLSFAVGHSSASRMGWSAGLPLVDTLGNRVQSAYTPSLAVLDNHMHLIVVKPDGRGTLAHYIYLESAGAWEYNTGWVVQPQTTAGPSVTTFATSGLLYLAYTANGPVNVCTYTPSAPGGPKYGTWSAPAVTGVTSTNSAPALFTFPQPANPVLQLAAVTSNGDIKEYVMGSSITQWTLDAHQSKGFSNRGVRAWATDTKAVLACVGGAASLWVTTRSKDDAEWLNFANTSSIPVAYGDPAPVIFDSLLYCFYVISSGSKYNLVFVTSQL